MACCNFLAWSTTCRVGVGAAGAGPEHAPLRPHGASAGSLPSQPERDLIATSIPENPQHGSTTTSQACNAAYRWSRPATTWCSRRCCRRPAWAPSSRAPWPCPSCGCRRLLRCPPTASLVVALRMLNQRSGLCPASAKMACTLTWRTTSSSCERPSPADPQHPSSCFRHQNFAHSG